MPPTHTGGPNSVPRVPILKRAVILALHWHAGMSFSTIEKKLGVKSRTASDIVRKAKERAYNPEEFDDVLACLESIHGGGREQKFPKGSLESEALRACSQQDEQHWQMPFPEILKELGIQAARSTLEKVFHEQHNIFCRKAPHKPGHTAEHMEARLAFAHMALNIAINTIVFTDEMWVEFNSKQRQWNISRVRGENSHKWALHDKNKESNPIRVMFWGAIALGHKGPCHVWEQDLIEDKIRFDEIVAQENVNRRLRQNENQQQARIPGTWQNRALQEFNANIETQNIEEGRMGRNKRRKRKREQMFKEGDLEFQSRGGINWVSYRDRVLQPKLYPFINQLQAMTGMPVTYLVEDNAPAHQTARKVDEEVRKNLGIISLNWPSKSPDLNQIERVWDYEKSEISTYQFGASQSTIEEAKKTLVDVWNGLAQEFIDSRCKSFHEKLEQVIIHGGNNNFEG